MLLLVLILVLIAFSLFVVALVSSSAVWAWLSVAVSLAAAGVLVADWLQRRSAVRAGSQLNPFPVEPDEVSTAYADPVTELLPVIRPGASGTPTGRGWPSAPLADDALKTTAIPVVRPPGYSERPAGATDPATQTSDSLSLSVIDSEDVNDRSTDSTASASAGGDAEERTAVMVPAGAEPTGGPDDRQALADGAAVDGAAVDGAPVDGAPVDGALAEGTRPAGVPADGVPAYGAPADGVPADGTPADGAPVDGAPVRGRPADVRPSAAEATVRTGAVAAGAAAAAGATGPAAAERAEGPAERDPGNAADRDDPAERDPRNAADRDDPVELDRGLAGEAGLDADPDTGVQASEVQASDADVEATTSLFAAGRIAPEAESGPWDATPAADHTVDDGETGFAVPPHEDLADDVDPAPVAPVAGLPGSGATGSDVPVSSASPDAGSAPVVATNRTGLPARSGAADPPGGLFAEPVRRTAAAGTAGEVSATSGTADTSEEPAAQSSAAQSSAVEQPAAQSSAAQSPAVEQPAAESSAGRSADAEVPAVEEQPPAETATAVVPPEEVRDGALAALVAGLSDEVVVVDESPRYHLPECRALVGVATIPLPVWDAVELGFTPCAWCSPDRILGQRHGANVR